MNKRFSKQKVLDTIIVRITGIQNEYHFDEGNGTAQLKAGDVDRAVAYGKYRALNDLCEELELD